jgi:hypothetical protein
MPMSRSDFESLNSRALSLLTVVGFKQAAGQRDGPFGSHYSEFALGRKRCRLVWDGKDSWLLAEHCEDFQEGDLTPWHDVIVLRAGRHASQIDLAKYGNQLIEALRTYVAENLTVRSTGRRPA